MNVPQVVEQLLRSPVHARCVTAHQHLPAQPAEYGAWPSGLDSRLRAVLARRGIEQLYTPPGRGGRAGAGRAERRVVTPTASGKTLCYNLPVLNAILATTRGARALPLPDQGAGPGPAGRAARPGRATLGVDIKTFTYDGDTPADGRRKRSAQAGHIVVTNPDMLHTGILPHHTNWVKLFENLRYVVIDELHHYRGVFGSHVANVHAAAAADLPLLRLRPAVHLLLGHHRQPARAGARTLDRGRRSQLVDRQRRAARAEGTSSSTTRRSSTGSSASAAASLLDARATSAATCLAQRRPDDRLRAAAA